MLCYEHNLNVTICGFVVECSLGRLSSFAHPFKGAFHLPCHVVSHDVNLHSIMCFGVRVHKKEDTKNIRHT